ncbi:MAG: hypothetical protein PVI90_13080, partial [Desulfobacteraceae bacterium]
MNKSNEWFRNGSTKSDEVLSYYDNWAETYDETLKKWNYKSPEYGATLHRKHTKVKGTICDAGCGTGMTGEALKNEGFNDIIG